MSRFARPLRGVALAAAGLALSAALLVAQQPPAQGQQPPAQGQQPPSQGQQPPGGRRGGGAGGRGGGRAGNPANRDRSAATGTATIAGRVVAADTGKPLKRARVIVAGGGLPHAATTDEQGRYKVATLPAGSYTVSATKTGFIDASYGQRRALGTGTAIDVTDGQQVADADLKLSRGSVITGRIFDEDGEPLSRTLVNVLRQQYVRGEKQLTTVGADQTDDRGQYRVFGLPPGDYYVTASAGGLQRMLDQFLPGRGPVDQPAETTGYAATYYPGVIAAGDAGVVKVAAAQELAGIDFQLQLVPLATVKGIVAGGGTVMLLPEDGPAGGGGRGGGRGGLGALLGGGPNLRTQTKPDGTFAIANVTPGRYTIVARTDGGPANGTRTAMQSIAVLGDEITVALTPAPGVRLSGTITLESGSSSTPKTFTGFRVVPQSIDSSAAGARAGRGADVTDKGLFSIDDVMAGHYVIRGVGARGWAMKAMYLNGQDVTDQPVEVGAENVSGLNIIFTDRLSSLSGTVRDSRGTAAAAATVIAFPSDPALWRPQSRQIVTARSDKAGAFKIATIPAGEYLVVAVDDVDPGEWFDPAFLDQVKDGATRVSIDEGEQKTQDLKLRVQPAPPLPSASSTR
jgi:carboxypeptidase family protein